MSPDDQNQIVVVPSYPAPSFDDLADLANDLVEVTNELQVDIVDGEFAPALSWPFTETDSDVIEELGRLMELPRDLIIEMDCMVIEPVQYLDTFLNLGVSRVIIHYGSTNFYDECLEHARNNEYLIGIAILPSVNLDEVIDLIEKFDYVQIMGISEVGAQGQPFDERALDVIVALREVFPDKEIAVDGAVNAETIPVLVEAGATRLAPGSAIVKATYRAAAYENLLEIANTQQ
jgi:ribulose-phosphate 3-epimerase